jgi:hypothetical protein
MEPLSIQHSVNCVQHLQIQKQKKQYDRNCRLLLHRMVAVSSLLWPQFSYSLAVCWVRVHCFQLTFLLPICVVSLLKNEEEWRFGLWVMKWEYGWRTTHDRRWYSRQQKISNCLFLFHKMSIINMYCVTSMYVCIRGGPWNPALAPRPSMIYCASPFN